MSTTTIRPRLCAVALVGKRQQPLLVLPFGDVSTGEEEKERLVDLNFAVFASLDVLDEMAVAGPLPEPYAGLLTVVGRYAVYAYVGPTLIRTFAVFDVENEGPKHQDVEKLLAMVHGSYQDFICNPFVAFGNGLFGLEDPVPSPRMSGFPTLVSAITRAVGSLPV